MEERASIERRAHVRTITDAHCMVKVGLEDSFFGYGSIRQISPGNVLVVTDIMHQMLPRGKSHLFMPGSALVLVGMERWNRHFSILGRIARLGYDQTYIACTIDNTTNDAFLREWIARGMREKQVRAVGLPPLARSRSCEPQPKLLLIYDRQNRR